MSEEDRERDLERAVSEVSFWLRAARNDFTIEEKRTAEYALDKAHVAMRKVFKVAGWHDLFDGS